MALSSVLEVNLLCVSSLLECVSILRFSRWIDVPTEVIFRLFCCWGYARMLRLWYPELSTQNKGPCIWASTPPNVVARGSFLLPRWSYLYCIACIPFNRLRVFSIKGKKKRKKPSRDVLSQTDPVLDGAHLHRMYPSAQLASLELHEKVTFSFKLTEGAREYHNVRRGLRLLLPCRLLQNANWNSTTFLPITQEFHAHGRREEGKKKWECKVAWTRMVLR